MLPGGPHPLQSKVALKDTCTNNKGPKQFSRVSNTCSMKMTNHQSWFSSMEQFRNLLFKQNCVLFSLFHWNSILSSSTQWLFGSTYFAQCSPVVIVRACLPQINCCVFIKWVIQGKLTLPLPSIFCLQSTILCPSTKHDNLTVLSYHPVVIPLNKCYLFETI